MDDTAKLVAIAAIHALKARYFRTLDTKDWAAHEAVFVPDLVADMREAAPEYNADALTHGAALYVVGLAPLLEKVVTVHHGHTPEILAAAIQRAGGPLPTVIIGTLPVVIAVASNLRDARRDGRLPWARLAPSLALIAAGVLLVNHAELQHLKATQPVDLGRYALGAGLAVGAVACWTWYPLRNADWLRAHPDRSPRAWATAQGLATLPLSAIGLAIVWISFWLSDSRFDMPLGPQPHRFVLLMLALGLLASWIGGLCWNEASQRLPTALAGQLIVFETLAALAYAFALRGSMPPATALAGLALLVAGVICALPVKPEPLPEVSASAAH